MTCVFSLTTTTVHTAFFYIRWFGLVLFRSLVRSFSGTYFGDSITKADEYARRKALSFHAGWRALNQPLQSTRGSWQVEHGEFKGCRAAAICRVTYKNKWRRNRVDMSWLQGMPCICSRPPVSYWADETFIDRYSAVGISIWTRTCKSFVFWDRKCVEFQHWEFEGA